MQRFEQLAKEGRGEEALALWRGTPLLGLRDERFADDARRRLEEQRLAVLEDRIDDDLTAGRHAELVPELEELVVEHPLREQLQGQLMRALRLRPAGGRAGFVPASPQDAQRRARARTEPPVAGTRAEDPQPGSGARASDAHAATASPEACATSPPPGGVRARRRSTPRGSSVRACVRLRREQHSAHRDTKLTRGHRSWPESPR